MELKRKFNLGRLDPKLRFESIDITVEAKTAKACLLAIEESWRVFGEMKTNGEIQ